MVSRPKSPAGTSVSNSKAVLCAHWSGSRASSVGTRGQNNQADPPTDRTRSFRSPRQLRVDPEAPVGARYQKGTRHTCPQPCGHRAPEPDGQTRPKLSTPTAASLVWVLRNQPPRAALARAHHCPGLEEEARGATQGTGRCRAAAMGHGSHGQENGKDSRRDPTLWATC